jgi:putative glycosyltransferase (TIGR04372 family)
MKTIFAVTDCCLNVFCTALFLPVAIIVILLRPILVVRVGYFSADRIGHFSFDLEYYLSEKSLSENNKRYFDVFFLTGRVCNEQLQTMAKRQLRISNYFKYLWLAFYYISSSGKNLISPAREVNNSRDREGIFQKCNHQLEFNDKEKQIGMTYLSSHGVDENMSYVCLVVRDPSYLSSVGSKTKDWSYHSYRDSNLQDYKDATIALARMGYTIFRMGKVVESKLKVNHENVIDYATSDSRSDFLDMWLMANCKFCISTALGLDAVASCFRRPILFVNALPLKHMLTSQEHVFVPKHLKWKQTGVKLSVEEYLQHSYNSSVEYENNGIEICSLAPLEIKNVAIEFARRVGNNWSESCEDRRWQQEFWKRLKQWDGYDEWHSWIHPKARIGADFIRENSKTFLG